LSPTLTHARALRGLVPNGPDLGRTWRRTFLRDDCRMIWHRRGWPYEPVDTSPVPPPSPPQVAGPEPPAPAAEAYAISRRAVLLLSIAGAVAIVLASLGVADWWVRNREMQTLLGRVERAERAQLPAIQGIFPLLRLCRQEAKPDEVPECDTVSIRQGAERILPRLEQTGEEVASTRLTSVHGSLRTFRDRYVAHNLAWRSWLETLSHDPTANSFRAPDAISTTFVAASHAADDALTPLPLHGNRGRVEAIFETVR